MVSAATGRIPSQTDGWNPSGPGPTIPASTTWGCRVAAHRESEELLQIEEADAWFEYLETTKYEAESRYTEIEPWAWSRLSQHLRFIKARRERLRLAAA